MTDTAWRTWAARLGWLTAAAFLAGAALVVFLQLNLPEPRSFPPDATFVDHLLASFEDAQAVWLADLGQSLYSQSGLRQSQRSARSSGMSSVATTPAAWWPLSR